MTCERISAWQVNQATATYLLSLWCEMIWIPSMMFSALSASLYYLYTSPIVLLQRITRPNSATNSAKNFCGICWSDSLSLSLCVERGESRNDMDALFTISSKMPRTGWSVCVIHMCKCPAVGARGKSVNLYKMYAQIKWRKKMRKFQDQILLFIGHYAKGLNSSFHTPRFRSAATCTFVCVSKSTNCAKIS